MPTAIIADDERLMRDQLRMRLEQVWPELEIVGEAKNGDEAVELVGQCKPDLTFLDIRMPGMTGLEAAAQLADEWPDGTPFPLLVFVTAYDQFALQAFERAAVDYVLKPVQRERLAQTVGRLQAALAQRQAPPAALESAIEQLRGLLGVGATPSVGASASPSAAMGASRSISRITRSDLVVIVSGCRVSRSTSGTARVIRQSLSMG